MTLKHNYAVLKLWLEEEIKAIGENPTGKEAKAECILILAEVNKGIEELQQLKHKVEHPVCDHALCVGYRARNLLIDEILGVEENSRKVESGGAM